MLAGFTLAVLLQCKIQSASADEIDARAGSERFISETEVHKRTADANALASMTHPLNRCRRKSRLESRGRDQQKGPYYVDFRARTAASWGHAFVWFGKTSQREVDRSRAYPAETLSLMYLVI